MKLHRASQAGYVLPMAVTVSIVVALMMIGGLEFVSEKTKDMVVIRAHVEAMTTLRSTAEKLALVLWVSERTGTGAVFPSELSRTVLEFKDTTGNRILFDGTPFAVIEDGREIVAKVWDESGLASLNAMTSEELGRFLTLKGMSRDLARRMADEVVDFRDRDNIRLQYGAEQFDYQQKGKRGPKNRAFVYSGELGQLLSFDEFRHELSFAQIRELGFDRMAQLNINAASFDVLRALGFTEPSANRFIEQRQRRQISINELREYTNSIDVGFDRIKVWPSTRFRIELTDTATGTPLRRTIELEGRMGNFDLMQAPSSSERMGSAFAQQSQQQQSIYETIDVF
jgi:hypothetical protein